MSTLLRGERLRVEAAGRTILDVPSLEVREGETLVLLGPTGAGKTTLLRVLGFLLEPSAGALFWRDDAAPAPFPPPLALRRRVAMAFQEPLLFQGTVAENVAWGLSIRGIRGEERRRRVTRALELFGISPLAPRSAQQLSGGEAQRVALARALVLEPELLLLDEPLASLDRVTRKRLADEIRQLVRSTGTTCVYVTHHQREGLFMADRVAVLERGRIVQVADPEEVFYQPTAPFVANFVGMENILPGRVTATSEGLATVEVGSRSVQAVSGLAVGAAVSLCLRPEEVVLRRGGGSPGDSARNHLEGTILSLRLDGPTAEIRLDCGFPLVAVVTRRSVLDLSLAVGERVEASFKATAVHLILKSEE
jgi:tungstate transport system ATP-binding protein